MKKRLIWILSGVLIIGIIFGGTSAYYYSFTLSTHVIWVREVVVNENNVSIKGDLVASAIGYKGYKVSSSNNKLFIKIKGSGLPIGKLDGSFNVTIDTTKYGKIEEVYLQDGVNSLKIWPL
ncbi:hypothetical protein EHS13_05075 [Paenibacillus psychroresistens]|uniref:Uncharacterized protein n=1 Tax=Paenibacillus psychroresistens TaxID=1778678 RepID=A0A6B8RCX7_9BACL|nr:hypothetical protein [Paenibacillus psychroresistens]QGQ94321.1 hypothetical protein EHS13_05075 [Paenibacillus psychroresistens]